MTRIKCYLISLFLGIILQSNAQAPNYVTIFSNSFGGSLNEDFFAGAPYSDGGWLLTGFTNSIDGDIDSLVAYDTTNILVVKCNSLGVKEWAKTFGGNAYDKARYVMEDMDGNILVVGGTYSVDGDIDTTHGNSEYFILKLDPLGNKIWMKQYGGTGYEGGRFITQYPNGDYFVAGYTTSHNGDFAVNRGLHDGLLMRVDVDGNFIWSNTYGGTDEDRMRSYVETPDGGYLYFGSSNSNDLQVSGAHGGADYWVGKVDSVGNPQWSKLYGGSLDELAYHITATADGNYLLTGATYSNDGDVTGFKGGTDGWLVKIDSVGNLLWQQCYGGSLFDRLNRSFENSDGKIMSFGFAQSSDFDLTGDNVGPSQNFWLTQLDSAHNIEWNYCTGGTNTDLGEDIFFNPADSSFILMGDSKSSNGAMVINHGDYDFSILKIAVLTSSINELKGHSQFESFYDNSTETLVIKSETESLIDLVVTDVMGKLISKRNAIKIIPGKNSVTIPELADVANGTYNMQLRSAGGISTLRFVSIH